MSGRTATRSALSDKQLAGERVIYSYSGLTPPASLISRIESGEAGGVILFKSNISGKAQIKRVMAELQKDAARSPVKSPLLIMTDQEGGEVRRLPGGPTMSEKQIGGSAHPDRQATDAGRSAGLNLKAVHMNVNLAPVLDVYRTAGDFIDEFERSYSNNGEVVAQLGASFIKAQQKAGVAATAKHFPGLGAAAVNEDTDAEPVKLNVSLSSLRSVDELPYKSAISAGVRLVMVSWATYPALDRHHPAGLSSTVVRKELRQRLGFKGVTITDALEAGALRAYGSTSNRALHAAGVGMDMLLCASQSVSQGTVAVDALASALRRGKLSRPSFTASVDRILALRESLSS